jgi:hypothetical protein
VASARRSVTDRGRLVYALLRTTTIAIPGPRNTRSQSTPGFRHADRYETCPDCLTNGKVPMPGCETCNGRGEVRAEAQRDPYQIKTAGFFGDDKQRTRDLEHARDREIERIDELLAQHAGQTAPLDALTRTIVLRDRLRELGSYDKLDQALEQLREDHPIAYRVAMWLAYQPFGEARVEPATKAIVTVCELLALRMDGDIRVPRFVTISVDQEVERVARDGKGALQWGKGDWHRLRRSERNALILAMAADGVSTTKIGLRLNLTRQYVRRILDEHIAKAESTATGPAA